MGQVMTSECDKTRQIETRRGRVSDGGFQEAALSGEASATGLSWCTKDFHLTDCLSIST